MFINILLHTHTHKRRRTHTPNVRTALIYRFYFCMVKLNDDENPCTKLSIKWVCLHIWWQVKVHFKLDLYEHTIRTNYGAHKCLCINKKINAATTRAMLTANANSNSQGNRSRNFICSYNNLYISRNEMNPVQWLLHYSLIFIFMCHFVYFVFRVFFSFVLLSVQSLKIHEVLPQNIYWIQNIIASHYFIYASRAYTPGKDVNNIQQCICEYVLYIQIIERALHEGVQIKQIHIVQISVQIGKSINIFRLRERQKRKQTKEAKSA